MLFDDGFGDGETKAGPLAIGSTHLVKLLEDLGQWGLWNTLSSIGHRQHRFIDAFLRCTKSDAAAGR